MMEGCRVTDTRSISRKQRMITAVESGDADALREVLTDCNDMAVDDMDMNALVGEQNTMLTHAVRYRYIEIVGMLLQHGADVNACAPRDFTALMCAGFVGSTAEIVRMLLDHGANVNMVDASKRSALWHAARNPANAEWFPMLLAGPHAVDVNANPQTGTGNLIQYRDTPLINAVRAGSEGMVRHLLEHQVDGRRVVDINKRGESRTTALIEAASRGVVAITKMLLAFTPADGDPPAVQVNLSGIDGETALYRAVDEGHTEVVRLLLSLQPPTVDVNLHPSFSDYYGIDEGKKPFAIAAETGHDIAIVQMLMDYTLDDGTHPVDVDDEDDDGNIAVLLALENHHYAIADAILAHPTCDLYFPLPYGPLRATQAQLLSLMVGCVPALLGTEGEDKIEEGEDKEEEGEDKGEEGEDKGEGVMGDDNNNNRNNNGNDNGNDNDDCGSIRKECTLTCLPVELVIDAVLPKCICDPPYHITSPHDRKEKTLACYLFHAPERYRSWTDIHVAGDADSK